LQQITVRAKRVSIPDASSIVNVSPGERSLVNDPGTPSKRVGAIMAAPVTPRR
jgi:hypothetical protein